MDLQGYRDELKLQLTGGVLELEIDDATIDKVIKSALTEVQRYIDTTVIETIPYKKCIDLSPRKINAVVSVYRTEGFNSADANGSTDPMYVTQWQLLSGIGNMATFQNYLSNYQSWLTTMQMRNTLSTDLAFRYDKHTNLLYINISTGLPENITIEYVPQYEDVSQIDSDFWEDILIQLAVAKLKIVLGRIRSKYTQSNALWTTDGETLLNEGNTELTNLRTQLQASTQLVYPID